MAFIVEDGTGLTDSTSYVSLEESNDYNTDFGNTSWSALTDAEKQTALIKGTQFIDNQYIFPGIKSTYDQALNWPRYEAYDCEGYELTEIPVKLKHAVIEAALRSLDGELLPDTEEEGRTSKVKVDVIEVEYQENTFVNNPYRVIDNILLTNCIALGNRKNDSGPMINLRT